jgi:hypothetical protein
VASSQRRPQRGKHPVRFERRAERVSVSRFTTEEGKRQPFGRRLPLQLRIGKADRTRGQPLTLISEWRYLRGSGSNLRSTAYRLCSKLCSDRVAKRRIGTGQDRIAIEAFLVGNRESRRDR